MENATYRKLQNFNNEVDEDKEFDIVLSLLRPEDFKILELYPDMSLSTLLEPEHILAYRLILEEGEDVTPENLNSNYNYIYSNVLFNYYTDDTSALQKSPIDYLSDNYSDLYDNEGYAVDEETGKRTADGEKLEVDLNYCYVIDGWVYEIR